jgi:hypothetical protein
MSRSQRMYQQDIPVPDGMINLSALDFQILSGGGTGTLTKIATGEVSLRLSTTTASTFLASLSKVPWRFGMQDDLQERFGSGIPSGSGGVAIGFPTTLSTSSATAGSSVNIPVLSSVNFSVDMSLVIDTAASGVQETTRVTAIPDATHITVNALANNHTTPFPISAHVFTTPAGVSGPPPFTGVTQFTPVTAPRPKGIRIKQINPRYIINTTNATVNTIGMSLIKYTNNVVAPAATALLTNAANGMSLVASANPYVTPIPIPVANQNYIIGQNSDVIIEWDITAGTTVDLLGVTLLCDFNLDG